MESIEERKSIGERLRQARLKAGIKQESATIEMNMNRSTLAAIEAGRRAVLAEELPGFAKLYGMTLEEILFGKETELTTEKEAENMNNDNLAAAPEIIESDARAVSELLTDYDQIKEKLTMEVISADRNAELLSEVPHEKMEDIAVVYKAVIEDAEDHRDTVLITNAMLDQFGVTHDQLKENALANAPVLRPAEIAGLTETIAKMSGLEAEDLLQGQPETTFVAMARGDQYGAGVMAYPNFLEDAAEKLGGDFFILPSSVHEILLVKDDGRLSGEELQKMVGDINAAEVRPEEQLTDHAYHYDSRNHVFELADSFAQRQAAEHEGRSGEKDSVIDGLKERKTEIARNDTAKDAVQKSSRSKGGETL